MNLSFGWVFIYENGSAEPNARRLTVNQIQSEKIKSNQMLVFEESLGKQEYPEKKFPEQRKEKNNLDPNKHLVHERIPGHNGER